MSHGALNWEARHDAMGSPVLKSIAGVVAGVMIAAAAYWLGAVVALLTMHGIPLGSAGGSPSTADVLVHLGLATAASAAGALSAVRIAGYRPRLHALLTGGLFGAFMFLGFSKPSSNWPAWFPYGMAVACAGGAWLASRRSSPAS